MNKLWEKDFEVNKEIERFTVGRDRELDLYLAKYDVLGSMAHIAMSPASSATWARRYTRAARATTRCW